jgi:hypothetical protein
VAEQEADSPGLFDFGEWEVVVGETVAPVTVAWHALGFGWLTRRVGRQGVVIVSNHREASAVVLTPDGGARFVDASGRDRLLERGAGQVP